MGIVNFGRVTTTLWRGGRYRARDLQVAVNRYGIQRVVDLRDRAPLFRPRTYAWMGVEFVHCPMNEFAPMAADVLLKLVGHEIKPTLVHCWRGAHRTGAVMAAYRILIQSWPELDVWREMQRYGFGSIEKHRALFESVFGDWRP